ncbi:MAG: hypothetical protein MK193_10640 [Lentisphaeria bacterium]|nr:hypothetical protein [Lentisphaeria bacterium]
MRFGLNILFTIVIFLCSLNLDANQEKSEAVIFVQKRYYHMYKGVERSNIYFENLNRTLRHKMRSLDPRKDKVNYEFYKSTLKSIAQLLKISGDLNSHFNGQSPKRFNFDSASYRYVQLEKTLPDNIRKTLDREWLTPHEVKDLVKQGYVLKRKLSPIDPMPLHKEFWEKKE